MTPRCGYYIEDGKVKEKTVEISWNMGFTKEAKYTYIYELHQKLHETLTGKIVEVTSAAPQDYGRALSPIFLKYNDHESLEDYWQHCVYDGEYHYYGMHLPVSMKREAFIHAYCICAEYQLSVLRLISVFTDVFHNPKKKVVTQAEACAVLKLMDQRGELDCLRSVEAFLDWYEEHGRR